MIRLSTSQVRVLIGLSQQRAEIQKALAEIAESEREYLSMLKDHYELPEGNYKILQQDRDLYIVEDSEYKNENGVNDGGEDDNVP